jgi:hypothetical protein
MQSKARRFEKSVQLLPSVEEKMKVNRMTHRNSFVGKNLIGVETVCGREVDVCAWQLNDELAS